MTWNGTTTRSGSSRRDPVADPRQAVRVVRPRPIDLRHPDDGGLDRLLPNLMIAGVTHAGASELTRLLARHPEIKRPVAKRIDLYDPMRYDQAMSGSLTDYDRHFATWRGQRYRVERAPTYFDGGRDLVAALARDLPDLRVLVLLRDPAARLWSSYRDKIASGRLPAAMGYSAYVERCLALRANGAERFEGNRYFRTLSSGLYVEHIGDWYELFGDRLRVVFTDQLDADPAALVGDVHRWLGLEPLLGEANARAASQVSRGGTALNGLQSFGATPPGGVRRLLPRTTRAALARPARRGRALLHRVGVGSAPDRRPHSPAERLYHRANRELADRLRLAGCRDLPGWLGG